VLSLQVRDDPRSGAGERAQAAGERAQDPGAQQEAARGVRGQGQ